MIPARVASVRIVSLVPSHTEILFALGLGDRVVGVTRHCDYPPEAEAKERVGYFGSPDPEKVAALKPDLVIAGSIHRDCARELRRLGIDVYEFEPPGLEPLLQGMAELMRITGERRGEEVVASLRSRWDGVRELAAGRYRPRIAFVMGEGTLAGPGTANCQYDALSSCGTEPMPFPGEVAFGLTNWEEVAAYDPEILLVCGRRRGEPARKRCPGCGVPHPPCSREVDEVLDNPVLAGVSALKEGRVYPVPCHFFCRPGPRLFDGMEWLVHAVGRDYDSPGKPDL